MNMIVDMLTAEAVIALAAGTVAKLQIRVVHIRLPADGALVGVQLLLVDLLCFLGSRRLRSLPQKISTFSTATTGTRFWGKRVVTIWYRKKAASISPRYLTLMGMMNMKSICISGNRMAKAKNMDRYR